MLLDLQVSKSVIINSSIENVWFILTNPEHIKQYLFGTETITDWNVGSKIVFQGVYNDHHYQDHGQILENIPETKIAYSYWSVFTGMEDKPENYSTISYTLKKIGANQTEFTWTQQGFSNEEGYSHSENSMDELLNSIKRIAEEYNKIQPNIILNI